MASHVVLLTEHWPPAVGGIEEYVYQIARHLAKGSVTVMAPRVRKLEQDHIEREQAEGGIRQVIRCRFFWPLIKPAWLPFFVWLWRWQKKQPIDFILCGKGLFEGLVAYYLKRYRGIPYVVFTYATEIATWNSNLRWRRKLKRVLEQADRVVYINEATKKTLLALGVKETRLVKIWPGVDERYFEKPSVEHVSQTLARYGVKKPYILSVARLIARKGLETLIEGFAQLDQTKFSSYHLVIVGTGPHQSALQQLASHVFMSKSIHFLGAVPTADLQTLYASADLFALTPKTVGRDMEGFGIVYLEAGAQGVASLATDSGGAAEAVLQQKTGLVVPPDNPVAVRDGLRYLLTNATIAQEYGINARERAWHEFRWSKRILLVKGMIDAIRAEQAQRRLAEAQKKT